MNLRDADAASGSLKKAVEGCQEKLLGSLGNLTASGLQFRVRISMQPGRSPLTFGSDLIAVIYCGLLSGYPARFAVFGGEKGLTKSWLSDGYWAGMWCIQREMVSLIYCRNSSSILISWAAAMALPYMLGSTLEGVPAFRQALTTWRQL